jgi:predicted nuclease of predicted toxin-antitoxin system
VKLLLDQNLSFKLVPRLLDLYPGSAHVRDFNLTTADDSTVWQFAKDNGFVIVSKDDDFHERSFVYGAPPKVIGIGLGNCSTQQIESLLRWRVDRIREFEADPQAAFLLLT